jgi:hypothetical protein
MINSLEVVIKEISHGEINDAITQDKIKRVINAMFEASEDFIEWEVVCDKTNNSPEHVNNCEYPIVDINYRQIHSSEYLNINIKPRK